MRWLILTTAVVLTSLGLGVGLSLGQQSDVIGSKHDIGSPGVSACEQCHIPHNAYGDYLWARNPDRADGLYLELKELCYSCHDGTVTDRGDFAFDQNLSQHPTNPGKRGEDCDMCHDAHGADYGNFLLFPAGANFCQSCHGKATSVDHPVDTDSLAAGYAPADAQWDPNVGDSSGTRLWDAGGVQPGTYVKCLSCHAAHGTTPGTQLNTMSYRDPTSTISPLCQNCHQ